MRCLIDTTEMPKPLGRPLFSLATTVLAAGCLATSTSSKRWSSLTVLINQKV